jgi:hypothetical protein
MVNSGLGRAGVSPVPRAFGETRRPGEVPRILTVFKEITAMLPMTKGGGAASAAKAKALRGMPIPQRRANSKSRR